MGEPVEAITLQTDGPDSTEALTDNYLKARIAGRMGANRWIRLQVEGVDGEMLVGRAVAHLPANAQRGCRPR